MSAWKIALPAALAGALVTIASYELGRRAGREERAPITLVTPPPGAPGRPAPDAAPSAAPSPATSAAPIVVPGGAAADPAKLPQPPSAPVPAKVAGAPGDDCHCTGELAYDAATSSCVSRDAAAPCDPTPSVGVLGCDGRAYPSACLAALAGLKKATPLPSYAKTQVEIAPDCICAPGQKFADGECKPGSPADVAACTAADKAPVCGCNHLTYPNECAARAAGVRKLAAGRCP